jgi:flavin reductase (DIM6/NTAB) family NADH-FMN oxidoreductase RutF
MNVGLQSGNASVVTLFRRLTLGVYVIGVADGSERDAFTAASVMQVSYKPLVLCVAVNPEHAAYRILRAGRSFAVSMLERGQLELARRFGTPAYAADKMEGVVWRLGCRGAPILDAALGYFDCAVDTDIPAGDHRIVLGRVIDGKLLKPTALPLSYADTNNMDNSAALFPASFESAA